VSGTERFYPFDGPLDIRLTLGSTMTRDPGFDRHDGTAVRATRVGGLAATLAIKAVSGGVSATAWGPGAEPALDRVPDLLGFDDEPEAFVPELPALAQLARRYRGMRMTRGWSVVEMLVPTIIEQRVTGKEAARSYRALQRRFGGTAPGPYELLMPPDPGRMRNVPPFVLASVGIDRHRADTLLRVCQVTKRMEEAAQMTPTDACHRLTRVRGIGSWTAWIVIARTHGYADAAPVGDFHMPNLVAWGLAGEPRGDDARMLELLEPYRGHRWRVIRLMELGGVRPPRWGPRYSPRPMD
jgi:3-methyladenine DNA glycosylase/8-oxoguanine DNA glycosylase